jgi:protocatechuate 3,4-dioxygenase beta subunit
MRSSAVVALLLVLPVQASLQQPVKGGIAGQVVDAVDTHPLGGARVTLMRLERAGEFGAAVPAAAVDADASGRFAFNDLDPGAYIVDVKAAGYTPQLDMGPVRRTSLVALTPGQMVTNLVVRLTAVGTVAGRVVDRAGRPIAGIAVALWFTQYSENGRKGLGGGYMATTDDRGEYRVAAVPRTGYSVQIGSVSSNRAPMIPYAGTLYPGVRDFSQGATVEVVARQIVTLKDVTLMPRRLMAVRGRVIDAQTGRPPSAASVWITSDSPLGAETIDESPRYNAADGTFETHVGPAQYVIGVTVLTEPGSQRLPSGAPVLPPAALEQTITVSDRDVDGVEFKLMPWVTLHGRLRADGQPLSSLSGVETIRVRLLRSRGGLPMASSSQMTLQSQFMPARDDGTFDIVSIAPGEFRLHVAGLPPDAYAKEARLGSADVLNGPLQFNGSAADVLEVVIGPNGGRIDGTAIDGGGAPAPNAFVVLMPVRRDRIDLFRSMSTDSGGRFTFRGIAPGEYAVVAGPEFQGYAYFDPDVLKRFEREAVRVTVRDGSRANVEVRLSGSAGSTGSTGSEF